MTLHLGLSSHAHSRSAQQQQDIKEARRLLKEKVRTDWDYPPLPAYQSQAKRNPPVVALQQESGKGDAAEDTERRIAGFRFHHRTSAGRSDGQDGGAMTPEGGLAGEDPVDWREREYSSTSTGEEEDEGPNSKANATNSLRQRSKDKRSSTGGGGSGSNTGGSPWRFEAPDSVGTQLSDRRKERKRKRDAALQEEMGWNDGLALWVARRDLWSGAQTAEQVRARRSSSAAHQPESSSTAAVQMESGGSGTASDGSTPRTSTSTTASASASASASVHASASSGKDLVRDETVTPTTTALTTTTPSTTPDIGPPLPSPATTSNTTEQDPSSAAQSPLQIPSSSSPSPSQQQQLRQMLIPVAPPILLNHPIRSRISTNTYPEIYSKIILQSRTPSVPINLQTLMHALVQGWKDDGEWPPKAGPVEKAIGRKKSGKDGVGALRHGVRAVGRVLRITSGSGTTAGGAEGGGRG